MIGKNKFLTAGSAKIAQALVLLALFTSCVSNTSPSSPTMAIDRPTYVDASDCSFNARLVIERKGLPDTLIHACKDERVKLDAEKVNLVTIWYGEAMDCPAGCVYESYVGIVTQSQAVVDLPNVDIATAMSGKPPFNEWRTWWTENHSIESHQEVAVRNSHYGWVLKLDYHFTQLYWKSYGADAELGKTLYTATGEIFVYLDSSGEEVWDFSQFEVSTKEL